MVKNFSNPLPMHSGLVLSEVYMAEMGLNQTTMAKLCECSPRKINEIVNGKRGISASFALVLESKLNTSAEMWLSYWFKVKWSIIPGKLVKKIIISNSCS